MNQLLYLCGSGCVRGCGQDIEKGTCDTQWPFKPVHKMPAVSSKRKGALTETSTMKTRFNGKLDLPSSSLSSLTLDSLLDHVIHLGGDVFTYVNTFKGQTSVHIRVY
ncbi:hypothetical protein AVEN_29245-1 [Araneus ventricosus]|uniref:Uncharacterized protein n=1 Tax=Araneus ventricosus TaxID=182803 RepID=A0A4Y2DYI1_ARAVE|nr:hypothetical protein AVEN_29245-1 [Araneus ventricosus]